MIYSCRKKILYDIDGLQPNSFTRFRLGYHYDSGSSMEYREVYSGLCFSDASGKATIQLDDVMRDFAYEYDYRYVYNQKQQYEPSIEVLGAVDAPIHSIEGEDSFYNALYVIEWGWDGESAYLHRDYVNVLSAMDTDGVEPLWRYDSGAMSPTERADAYHTGLNHVPAKATANYYFSVLFYKGAMNGDDIYLCWDSDGDGDIEQSKISPVGSGSYNFLVPLNLIFKAMPMRNEVLLRIGNTSYKRVATIDLCPAKYYLTWVDRYGVVNSYGFEGNSSKRIESSKMTIKGYDDDDIVVNSVESDVFSLNSGYVNDEVYNQLCEIVNSNYILLYDVDDDRNYVCYTTESKETKENGKLNNFSLELKKIDRVF